MRFYLKEWEAVALPIQRRDNGAVVSQGRPFTKVEVYQVYNDTRTTDAVQEVSQSLIFG